MEQSLRVVVPCKVCKVICFITSQNKSAVEIHRELCLCHHLIICIDIQLPYTEHISLWISIADLFWCVKKTNNRARLARHNYTQRQLHFQYRLLYIFVKRLLHNFYGVVKNSKIISPCNFTLIGSQNAKKKIGKLTFDTTLVFEEICRNFRKIFGNECCKNCKKF